MAGMGTLLCRPFDGTVRIRIVGQAERESFPGKGPAGRETALLCGPAGSKPDSLLGNEGVDDLALTCQGNRSLCCRRFLLAGLHSGTAHHIFEHYPVAGWIHAAAAPRSKDCAAALLGRDPVRD